MFQLKIEKAVNNTKIPQMSELSDKDFEAATKEMFQQAIINTCNK